MIATMRPDIDHVDEYVRNTTARAFAVVASALGIPALLPFLKAVCRSKKSWQARHTGIKIVQQIAILLGCAILPHLKNLVDIIQHGLTDEQQKARPRAVGRGGGNGGGADRRAGVCCDPLGTGRLAPRSAPSRPWRSRHWQRQRPRMASSPLMSC